MDCEMVARGIQAAYEKLKIDVPLIVRLEGNYRSFYTILYALFPIERCTVSGPEPQCICGSFGRTKLNYKFKFENKYKMIKKNISLSKEDILRAKIPQESVKQCELVPQSNP